MSSDKAMEAARVVMSFDGKATTGAMVELIAKNLDDFAAEAVAAEKERCARQLEGFATNKGDEYAAAIRARKP